MNQDQNQNYNQNQNQDENWANKQKVLHELKDLYFYKPVKLTQKQSNDDKYLKESKDKFDAIQQYTQEGLNNNPLLKQKQSLEQAKEKLTEKHKELERHIVRTQEIKNKLLKEEKEAGQSLEDLQNYKLLYEDKDIMQEINEQKEEMKAVQKNRSIAASKLNISAFSSIVLKNKDNDNPLHELWKWTIVVIYSEATSSYYWEDFRKQVFLNDQGKDFKLRLEKTKVFNMKKEEVDITVNILQKKQLIISQPQLNANLKGEIETLFIIIEKINHLNQLSMKILKKEGILKGNKSEKEKVQADSSKIVEKVAQLGEYRQNYEYFEGQQQKLLKDLANQIKEYQREIEKITNIFERAKIEYTKLPFDNPLLYSGIITPQILPDRYLQSQQMSFRDQESKIKQDRYSNLQSSNIQITQISQVRSPVKAFKENDDQNNNQYQSQLYPGQGNLNSQTNNVQQSQLYPGQDVNLQTSMLNSNLLFSQYRGNMAESKIIITGQPQEQQDVLKIPKTENNPIGSSLLQTLYIQDQKSRSVIQGLSVTKQPDFLEVQCPYEQKSQLFDFSTVQEEKGGIREDGCQQCSIQ